MKRTHNQSGIGAVAIIVIIAVLVMAGYYAYNYIPSTPVVDIVPADTDQTVTNETAGTSSAASSTNPILGTEWSWLRTIVPEGSMTPAPAGNRFILTFNHDMRVNSTTDCNGLSGMFVVDGEVLSFSPLLSTKMACADTSLETEYARQLGLTASYVIEGDELRLNLVKDAGTMIFTRLFRGEFN